MIAQILTKGRRGLATVTRSVKPADGSRALDIGVQCTRVGVAILLLPALATVLVVGGLGAAAVGLVAVATRVRDVERRPPAP